MHVFHHVVSGNKKYALTFFRYLHIHVFCALPRNSIYCCSTAVFLN